MIACLSIPGFELKAALRKSPSLALRPAALAPEPACQRGKKWSAQRYCELLNEDEHARAHRAHPIEGDDQHRRIPGQVYDCADGDRCFCLGNVRVG